MLKRIISIILALSFLVSTAGCTGALRKKFVRKKKYEKKTIPVFKPKTYEAEFNKEQRYANHFAFWKNAQTELINMLDGKDPINNKKLKFQASYAVAELEQMHNLLPDEKQQQIKPYIAELTDSAEKLKDSSYVSSHKHTLAKKLKHIYNKVAGNFSYRKMKSHLAELDPGSREEVSD